MVAIIEKLTIKAEPQRVWRALTEQDEIIKWWTYEARVEPVVGSIGEFSFRQGAFTLRLEVAELEPYKKVRWISREVPPPWAGTSIIWQLEPIDNATTLTFTHDGFAQNNEQVATNWTYFLASLKSYLETGKGTPGNPPSFR